MTWVSSKINGGQESLGFLLDCHLRFLEEFRGQNFRWCMPYVVFLGNLTVAQVLKEVE